MRGEFGPGASLPRGGEAGDARRLFDAWEDCILFALLFCA